MIIILELIGFILAALLLFMPVTTFPYMIFHGSLFVESAFALAYLVILLYFWVLARITLHELKHPPTWKRIGRLLLVSSGCGVGAFASFLILALMFNAVDSSHGGSFIMVLLAIVGSILAVTVFLSERTRRAL